MSDIHTFYFLNGALERDDIGALFAHQARTAWQQLGHIYRNTADTHTRHLIRREAYAQPTVGAVASLAGALDDAAEIVDWIAAVRTEPWFADGQAWLYRRIVNINAALAVRLFHAGDDTMKLGLAVQGVVGAMAPQQMADVCSWLTARYPAGSLADGETLSSAAGEYATIASEHRDGSLAWQLEFAGRQHWLLLFRAWVLDSTTRPAPAVLTGWAETLSALGEAEETEVNVLSATISEPRANQMGASERRLFAALAKASRHPSPALTALAHRGKTTTQEVEAELAAEATARLIREDACGAWAEISKWANRGPGDSGRACYRARLCELLAGMDPGATLPFVASAITQGCMEPELRHLVMVLLSQLDPVQLARHVTRQPATVPVSRWLGQPILTELLWHAPVTSSTVAWILGDTKSAETKAATQACTDRVTTRLGSRLEFHSLIGTWRGSLAELVDAITVARL